ncbi:ABC transporter ATP-binding protein [Bacillus sp. 165]|uniref:ABC transporter ATP-binding protein n=1 Tax=Bacillus sp. 165 TaxID=1529117 RepID=UPI001AD9A83E|nr:ABC transporter ATP-binding protein [Bacillus sp. 165]MBO9130989.1 ABC transporter ATP-binding protein [Bacillus sp. 165]
MSKALSFLKPYRFYMTIALSFMLVELAVELWQPLLMAKIIDDGVMEKDLHVVFKWGGVMVGISIIAFIAGVLNSFYAAHISQSYGYDVRTNVFKKVQAFSFTNFNQFPAASLITRMTNDVTQIQNTVFMSLRIMLRAPLLVIGGTIMALIVDFKLALFLVIVIPLLITFLIWAMNRGAKLFRSVQGNLDAVNGVMRENLLAMRLIKALIRRGYELKRFTKASEHLKNRTVSVLRLMETTMPVLLLVMNLCILGILWFGNMQINTGETKIGEVVAILNYATRITAAFTPLSFIIMAFSRARASAQRITEVLETTIDLTDSINSSPALQAVEGEVEFTEVAFRYPGTDSSVLSDISFNVSPGEMVAVLGATGAGKSSLFQLIPRLYDVNEGAILVDGQDVRKMKLEYLRKQIGFVPQEALLFTGTVKENIMWGKEDASMDEIIEAAKSAQIHDTICKLPMQYDTVLGQKGVNLSGGQKQRLSIARALVRKPKILLLDDSTSALDLKTEAKLLQAIKQYTCTIFIITQKISTAMAADKILLLEEGKLLAEGDHSYLLQNSSLYKRIFQSQFAEEEGRKCLNS